MSLSTLVSVAVAAAKTAAPHCMAATQASHDSSHVAVGSTAVRS
ncbi:hypothetical protein [Streptomyces antarcticus]|nr:MULTISPECIES: hypothetical protein [unclassified Streptomyces]MCY0947258.1 hypothetical protein [Streptomyces sp. H34-AA3]MCZ4086505.1 hypothetical protein [Streptomyces sp. H34-S5]